MYNFNKKTVLILLISATVVLSLFTLIAISGIGSENEKEGVDEKISSSDQKISSENYYVEPGLEKMAKIAKDAVENFANQDKSEKNEDRIKRLKKYFTPNSPVYSYEQRNINDGIVKKSISTVTSIAQCAAQEDGSFCMNVTTETTYHLDGEKYTNPQTYGLTVIYKNGEYIAEDIGLIE